MKEIKCGVCDEIFKPYAQFVYTAQAPNGLFDSAVGGRKLHDAIDCPACGCQNRLGARFEALDDGGDTDD